MEDGEGADVFDLLGESRCRPVWDIESVVLNGIYEDCCPEKKSEGCDKNRFLTRC
jgi:hypothetical protein